MQTGIRLPLPAAPDLAMTLRLPSLVATSVVRGAHRDKSEGGVFVIDFEERSVEQRFDWNSGGMDFEGASGDRGLRGIAASEDDVLIAGSDVLFRCDPDFNIRTFSRNRYLNDCQEICRYQDKIFLTSPGFDSLLAFDLGTREYIWGYHLIRQYGQWAGHAFDPRTNTGPVPVNDYHINMVHVDETGIYFSGLRTEALLHLGDAMEVSVVCSLPAQAHNARPFRDGVLLNDTGSDCVRYAGRDGSSLAFKAAAYDGAEIEFGAKEDTGDLRQGFARGLCVVGDRFVAAGSSPSTISLYDWQAEQRVASVNLSMDIRNAIGGLAPWPL